MFLILSAAYIDQELKSEFGVLPPAMLPIGNRRLFKYQVNSAPQGEKIYLTLPESYQISSFDHKWLKQKNVSIIHIPDGINLGESIVVALNLIEDSALSALHILHGDTLSLSLPDGNDIVGIATVRDNYNWAVISTNNFSSTQNNSDLLDEHNVVMGYFKFSNPHLLIRSIIKSKWDFIKGLNLYHESINLNTVRIDSWLDFGHVNTFYQSKSKFTTQRAFNHLDIKSGLVTKSGSNNHKLESEALWFQTVPPLLRQFLPQYLGQQQQNGQFSYSIEYLNYCALNELYVFSALPDMVWNNIYQRCLDFLDACSNYQADTEQDKYATLDELLLHKTATRLQDFCSSRDIDSHSLWQVNDIPAISLDGILSFAKKHLPPASQSATIMHGDFCFSNILYDFRSERIKTFDPRGITASGEQTIYGEIYYDIAKLSHSVIGMYDFIISGYYELEVKQQKVSFHLPILENKLKVQNNFINLIESRYHLSKANLYAMQIYLFLSMLSLHADDSKRQMALLANAFRLYQLLKEIKT